MKTCFITGASGGIGSGIARAFGSEGYNLVLGYNKNEEGVRQLEKELAVFGVPVLCVKGDVSKESDLLDMLKKANDKFGFVDTVVCNAGTSLIKQINDTTESDFDDMINVNLKGVYLTAKVFSKQMIQEQFGRIITISSMWGNVGASCETAYSSAKGGVITFTKALAKELAPSKITVNCVCPGLIDTPMNASLDEQTLNELVQETPLGRIGKPDDVANAVLFFASRKASFITGQVITVDGGFTL